MPRAPHVVERAARAPALVTLERAVAPVALVVAAVAVLGWTWGKWPDAVVDYGRELYLAWQVAEGRTLYVDVTHFNGPLSVTLNALLFRVFGVGMQTLVVANIVLTALFTALLYDLLGRLAGRVAALGGCLVFVLVFACGQLTRIGNFNWVCPYSYELTHGTMLAVAALWCLARHVEGRRDGWLIAMGGMLGLLALTKLEPMLAGGVAVAVGLVLVWIADGVSPGRAAKQLGLIAGAAAVPLVVTAVFFAPRMPVETLLQWPLGHWTAAARPEIRDSKFYAAGMGLDAGASNASIAALTFFWEALAAAVAVGAAMLLRPFPGRSIVAGGLGLATAGAVWRWIPMATWGEVPRAFPIWMAIMAGAAFYAFVRRGDDRAARVQAALRTAFVVFAAAMLAKMLLNTRIFQYGFVLALPATLVLVVGMLAWLPAFVDRLGGYGGAVRAIGIGVLVAGVATHLTFMQTIFDRKTIVVSRGADLFYTDDRGALAAKLLEKIESLVAPDETLLVLPQGVMLNYLARRANSTPYYLFDSTARALYGEDVMTDRVRSDPPDWVAFVERGVREVWAAGRRFRPFHDWVRAHYTPVWQIGTPFQGQPGPGVALLRRNPEP